MSGQGDDRSIGLGARPVRAGVGGQGDRSVNVSGGVHGGVVNAGDDTEIAVTVTRGQPPAGPEVDVAAEIAGLRALLEGLDTPERGRLGRAMEDAGEEAAKPSPDRQEVADALERAVKASKGAADFADNADRIRERVARIAGWLGPLAKGALALLGPAM